MNPQRGHLTDRWEKSRWIGIICCTVLGAVTLMAGIAYWSRPPVVASENLKFLQLLRTACSSRNPQYVAGVERALQLRRQESQLSDSEWNHFAQILTMAKKGEWERADAACLRFEQSQSGRRR